MLKDVVLLESEIEDMYEKLVGYRARFKGKESTIEKVDLEIMEDMIKWINKAKNILKDMKRD